MSPPTLTPRTNGSNNRHRAVCCAGLAENPDLPAEAIQSAIDELTRDRSANLKPSSSPLLHLFNLEGHYRKHATGRPRQLGVFKPIPCFSPR